MFGLRRALMTQSHLFLADLSDVIILLYCLFGLVRVLLFRVYPVIKLILFLLLKLNADVFLLVVRQRIYLLVMIMVTICIDEISRLVAPRLYHPFKIFYRCLLLFLWLFENLPHAHQEIFVGQDLHVAHFSYRLLNWQLNNLWLLFCKSLLWHQRRRLCLRQNFEAHGILIWLICILRNWWWLSASSQWSEDLYVRDCRLNLARPWWLWFAICRRLFEDRTWQRKNLDWICEL